MKRELPSTSSIRPESAVATPSRSTEGAGRKDAEQSPDLWLYRQHTIALLRRYFRLSVELGRLPSLLGREFFRAHVSSYRMSSFEDGVIFAHDVERCLEKIDLDGQQLIARIVFQEYTAEETAALLGCARRTIVRRYMEALDQLSDVFLTTGLLRAFPSPSKTCEAGRDISASAQDSMNLGTAPPAAEKIPVKPCLRAISPQAALIQANIIRQQLSQLYPAV